MTHDTWLMQGKGGPNDDNEPVDCPTCHGCAYGTGHYFAICKLCGGSGLVDRETAEAMQETPEPDED